MEKYGIVLDDSDEQIGAWRVVDPNHMELNVEDGQLDKIVQLAEVTGEARIKFMIDPESME